MFAGLVHLRGDGVSGLGVVVEEGARDVRPAGDGGDADPGLLAPQPGDGLANALEGSFGPLAAGRKGSGRARFLPSRRAWPRRARPRRSRLRRSATKL